jgi:hypothetical protein
VFTRPSCTRLAFDRYRARSARGRAVIGRLRSPLLGTAPPGQAPAFFLTGSG